MYSLSIKPMKGLITLMTLILGVGFLSGCGTTQYSRGEFGDTNKVNLLNDKFTESTAELLAKSVVEQFKTCPTLTQ
ncbi:MAG: hypothetical protein KF802_02700 [Bdellovibrionaceae bacterium]|nr:hypothetical protein [Pseudobdellovibrionaceae bacterium]